MEISALLRAEWSTSRRLSRVQRLVAGVLSVITFVLFSGLFQMLKPVGPLFFSVGVIPVSLFTLALFGGPIKQIFLASFGAIVGVAVVNMV
jgi:hypothetical protein